MKFLHNIWSNPLWRMVILLIVIGIPIGLGLFTFSYAKGGSYLSDDPAA